MANLEAHVREQQVAALPGGTAVNFLVITILDPTGYQCWATAITAGETTGGWTLPAAGTYHTVITGLGGTMRSVTITPGTGSALCPVDAGVVEITLVASAAGATVEVG